MSLTKDQELQLKVLLTRRDSIVSNLYDMEHILKQYFPEEFEIAYQFWIPQITTALYEDKKWLARGNSSMEQTINRLKEKLKD